MKMEYKIPMTEIVYLNTDLPIQEETTDTGGHIPGTDPGILTNETFFDEEDISKPSKSLWD